MSSNQEIRNIAVIGTGGVGGYYGGRIAWQLGRAPGTGRTVSFLARGAHLEAIRRDGLALATGGGEELSCRPTLATDRIDGLPTPDLCLLCIKGYDLPDVLQQLAPRLGPDSVILPLLNGVDIYDRVREAVPGAVTLPACTYVSVNLESPGRIVHRGNEGLIILGADPARPGYDGEPVRRLLEETGIRFRWSEEPFAAIWEKYLFIAALGLVTAWTENSMGEVLGAPALRDTAQGIMDEILALARARRVPLSSSAARDALEKAAAFPPETRTSYQRDVEARRRTEGELFGGAILSLGKRHGVPTPVTERVYREIQARLGDS
ncbi:MAG: 2-dehydropantoate 2-reductase [Spirochaetales bacterium]|nr:2-dehydropantoate 2-reductase [Spirochaetales bacterium]